jgi:hypothetical protein
LDFTFSKEGIRRWLFRPARKRYAQVIHLPAPRKQPGANDLPKAGLIAPSRRSRAAARPGIFLLDARRQL